MTASLSSESFIKPKDVPKIKPSKPFVRPQSAKGGKISVISAHNRSVVSPVGDSSSRASSPPLKTREVKRLSKIPKLSHSNSFSLSTDNGNKIDEGPRPKSASLRKLSSLNPPHMKSPVNVKELWKVKPMLNKIESEESCDLKLFQPRKSQSMMRTYKVIGKTSEPMKPKVRNVEDNANATDKFQNIEELTKADKVDYGDLYLPELEKILSSEGLEETTPQLLPIDNEENNVRDTQYLSIVEGIKNPSIENEVQNFSIDDERSGLLEADEITNIAIEYEIKNLLRNDEILSLLKEDEIVNLLKSDRRPIRLVPFEQITSARTVQTPQYLDRSIAVRPKSAPSASSTGKIFTRSKSEAQRGPRTQFRLHELETNKKPSMEQLKIFQTDLEKTFHVKKPTRPKSGSNEDYTNNVILICNDFIKKQEDIMLQLDRLSGTETGMDDELKQKLKDSNKALNEQQNRIKEIIENWQRVVKNGEHEDTDKKIRGLTEKMQKQTKTITELRAKIAGLQMREGDRKPEVKHSCEEEIKKLKKDLAVERQYSADARKKARSEKTKCTEIQNTVKALENQISKQAAELKLLKTLRQKETDEIKRKGTKIKALENTLKEQQAALDQAMQEINEQKKSYEGFVTTNKSKSLELVREITDLEEEKKMLLEKIEKQEKEISDLSKKKSGLLELQENQQLEGIDEKWIIINKKLKKEKDEAMNDAKEATELLRNAKTEIDKKSGKIYKLHEFIVLLKDENRKLRHGG